ncbi:hypothetical protein ACJRO7_010409 [Eucalyptus globulus]|uniref:Uncharacterized protein n=1 Tax=Eucalyptus globulus TaxID=34317 RepID=A0ABD3LBX5_EUCGL
MSTGLSTSNEFSTLMQNAFEVMSLGTQDENIMRITRKNLNATVIEISSYNSIVTMTDGASDDNDNEASLCEMLVLDPLQKKGNGTSYERLKASKLIVQATHVETHLSDYSRNANQIQNAFCPGNIGGPLVNINFHNQMQQSYIMPPRIMNVYSPFTSQMVEYHNRFNQNILSQSSNSFQHPKLNELNDSERGDNA